MDLKEFSEKYIEENMQNPFYTNMPEYLRQIVDTLISQKHSGGSFSLLMLHLERLNKEYEEQ